MKTYMNSAALIMSVGLLFACTKSTSSNNTNTNPGDTTKVQVAYWMTTADHTVLFKQQNPLTFASISNGNATITVDTTQSYQTMDGFGFCLTGGSAYVMNKLSPGDEDALLHELFAIDSNHIGISYLRISIGASDLNSSVFTYDDMASGQTDTLLANFSIAPDMTDLVPVLKKILNINPSIKILGTPWSAPSWMKTNDTSVGGNFNHQYYQVYANYFVKYIQAMRAQGITIDAITPQNEPMNPGNNPSMLLSASEEDEFIKNYLGPTFSSAGVTTKIIIFDHNCGNPEYPLSILSDTASLKYIDGTAFHLYSGDITALTQIHNAAPQKNVYFTEQWVGAPGNFATDFDWGVKNLVIGASNNWAKCVLQWNLANDPGYGPHTPGGCTACLGAVTISTSAVRNTAYYTIAHASKFVRPGSVRVSSNIISGLPNVAFVAPGGKKVLIVLNESGSAKTFNISFKGKIVAPTLPSGAVATFTW